MEHQRKYLDIVAVYEQCFAKFGATCKGVDWPNQEEVDLRYKQIMDVVRGSSVLDIGCGFGGLLNYIKENGYNSDYVGVDLGESYISYCKDTYPENAFYRFDVLADEPMTMAEYVVLNGVLTAKYDLSHLDMLKYAKSLICECYDLCTVGLLVNFHSCFSRPSDKLFRPSLVEIMSIVETLSKRYWIKHDYLDFEYFLCVLK